MKLSATALLAFALTIYGQETAAPGPPSNTGCAISIEPKMWGLQSQIVVTSDDPERKKPTSHTYYTAKDVEIRIGTSVIRADSAVVELPEKPGELADVQLKGVVRLRTRLTRDQMFSR